MGGPEVFEPFLRSYLQKYSYQSVMTDDFKSSLYDYFVCTDKNGKLNVIDWDLWLNSEGMPPIIPEYVVLAQTLDSDLLVLTMYI